MTERGRDEPREMLSGKELAEIFDVSIGDVYDEVHETDHTLIAYRKYQMRGVSAKYRARFDIGGLPESSPQRQISVVVEAWPEPKRLDQVPIHYETEVVYDMVEKRLYWRGRPATPKTILAHAYEAHCSTIQRRGIGIRLLRRWNWGFRRILKLIFACTRRMLQFLGWRAEAVYKDGDAWLSSGWKVIRIADTLIYVGIPTSKMELLIACVLTLLAHFFAQGGAITAVYFCNVDSVRILVTARGSGTDPELGRRHGLLTALQAIPVPRGTCPRVAMTSNRDRLRRTRDGRYQKSLAQDYPSR